MARRRAGDYTPAMDNDPVQAALRARAEEAMAGALSAAQARVPIPRLMVETALGAVRLACWDAGLKTADRLSLVEESMDLLAALREFTEAPEAARLDRGRAILRRTNDLLRRYAALRVSAGAQK